MAIVSDAVSQGSILGWRLKSVNQLHALRTTNNSGYRTAVRLRLMPHLHRAVLAQHLRRFLRAIGTRGHPHAEVSAAEARIVAHCHRETRHARQSEEREHG